MSDAWKQWEGQVVRPNFPLTRYLGGSEHSAVFLTERRDGERVVAAAIKLIPLIPEKSESQFSKWELAAGLSHPHLVRLFEFGKSELGGVPLLFVVMELAEENLGQVLAERALTPDETRTMLEPLLDVLGYLHKKGLVHGHIKPTNILANGDELKLSSDALSREGSASDGASAAKAYDPPENSPGFIPMARTMSPAADAWSLGMTMVECLTQHVPVTPIGGQGNPPVPQTLPEPFLDIARHCLLPNPASRCTFTEITARLRDGSASMPQARKSASSSAKPTARVQGAPPKPHNYTAAIVVGVLLAAIVVGYSLFRHHSEAPQASAPLQEGAVPATQDQPVAAGADPTTAPAPSAVAKAQDSVSAAPVPVRAAPASPASPNVPAATPSVKAPAEVSGDGEVLQQVLPDVPRGAKDTIKGTIKIAVKVDVDSSGMVKDAKLETPGPSKYFAHLAEQAAQHWRFSPSKNGASSSWTLRFQFTRADTTVNPLQDVHR